MTSSHKQQQQQQQQEETSMAARNLSQNAILAGKVSRALEVRSDTPAMKAALDALAHLPDQHQHHQHQDESFSVDSRSVRVAIEQDALHQALLLQNELKHLLETVGKLRQGVSETAAIAQKVKDVIHTNVISANATDTDTSQNNNKDSQNLSTTQADSNNASRDDDDSMPTPGSTAPTKTAISNNHNNNNEDNSNTGTDRDFVEEQQLAALLNESFAQRDAARKRVETVHAFLEKFDLSEEDSRLLDHYSFEDVETSHVNGSAFLVALDRVRLIRGRTFGTIDILNAEQSHRERSSSSSSGSNNSETNRLGASSALRMMEVLAQKQERAYERLYHWLQSYLHVHDHDTGAYPDEDQMDEALAHPFVRQSIYTLRNVPAFYSHLLELIANSRRSEETRRFLLALTSGHGGLPPIEMRAHDSVVYVGDMLAFCFRAFSVEADVTRGLINYVPESSTSSEEKDDGDRHVALAGEEIEFGMEESISASEILAQSIGGISRPLKARILHVVASLSRRHDEDDDDSDDGMDVEEEGATARNQLSQLYEICGLLLFYASATKNTISKLDTQSQSSSENTGENEESPELNPLLAAIFDCLSEATSAYEASLRVYGATLEHLNVVTGDSEALLAYTMIARIVEVRKASPGFANDIECPSMHKQILAIDWACDVLIEAALPACKSLDDAVTLRQSITIARNSGLSVNVSQKLEGMVQKLEASLIDVLVEKESIDVLDLCGLGTLVGAWKSFDAVQVEGMVMATHPGLSQDDVQSAMSEFYSSLYSPPLPSFESTIKDPALRKLARGKIAENVCSAYESLYVDITRPDKGGYDDISFLGHTPKQVKTLFTA